MYFLIINKCFIPWTMNCSYFKKLIDFTILHQINKRFLTFCWSVERSKYMDIQRTIKN